MGGSRGLPSFKGQHICLAVQLVAAERAQIRIHAAIRRAESGQRRTDTRRRVMEKWLRTRHLIELGGLVQKSELADLAGDDLASLYGAMLELVEGARDADAAATLTSWRQRGQRALQLEAAIVTTAAHKDI